MITNWKQTTKVFSWFWKSIKGLNWLIHKLLCWKAKNTCVVFFIICQTCREILWSFFFFVKPLFPCRIVLSIWSPFHWRNSPLFICETKELNLEFPIFSCLIQRIWLFDFGNLSPLLRKFFNKKIFIFNSFFLIQLEDLILFVRLNFVAF